MKDYLSLLIWALVVGGLFAFLWWKGHLRRLADYVAETRDELTKCNWPSVDELKGSTFVVVVVLGLMALFTVGVDVVVARMIRWML